MRPIETSLNLDNVLFFLAIAMTAGFAIDRFLGDEPDKTPIAQASELRKSAFAQASEICTKHLADGDKAHEAHPCELRKEFEQ